MHKPLTQHSYEELQKYLNVLQTYLTAPNMYFILIFYRNLPLQESMRTIFASRKCQSTHNFKVTTNMMLCSDLLHHTSRKSIMFY